MGLKNFALKKKKRKEYRDVLQPIDNDEEHVKEEEADNVPLVYAGERQPLEIGETSAQASRGSQAKVFMALTTLLVVPFMIYFVRNRHESVPSIAVNGTVGQLGNETNEQSFSDPNVEKDGPVIEPQHSTSKQSESDENTNAAAKDVLLEWPPDDLNCAKTLDIDFLGSYERLQHSSYFCIPTRSGVEETPCHCNSTVQAMPQSSATISEGVWRDVFERNKQIAENVGPMDVVLVGDSIVEHLMGAELGKPVDAWAPQSSVFHQLFTRKVGGKVEGLALGIHGDRCAQLLYRLQNGEISSTLNPKVWWVLIGTNDLTDHCSAESVLGGIVGVLQEIRRQRPSAKIVVNSILPRPRDSALALHGLLWARIDWINTRLACFAEGLDNVDYFDATPIFVTKDRSHLNKDQYVDWVHPSARGMRDWGEAIVEKVQEVINHD